jgi:hypothetical protein
MTIRWSKRNDKQDILALEAVLYPEDALSSLRQFKWVTIKIKHIVVAYVVYLPYVAQPSIISFGVCSENYDKDLKHLLYVLQEHVHLKAVLHNNPASLNVYLSDKSRFIKLFHDVGFNKCDDDVFILQDKTHAIEMTFVPDRNLSILETIYCCFKGH